MKKSNDYVYVSNKAAAIAKSTFKSPSIGTRYCIIGRSIYVYQFPHLLNVELEHMAKGLGIDLIAAQKILTRQIEKPVVVEEKTIVKTVTESVKETVKEAVENEIKSVIDEKVQDANDLVEDKVSSVEEKVEELKETPESVQEKLETTLVGEEGSPFNELKDKVDSLTIEIKNKEQEISKLTENNEQLKDQAIGYQEEIESLNSVIEQREKRIQELEDKISAFDVINPAK